MNKWKLVPVEPDEQQIYAMRSAFYKVRRGGAGGQTLYACYQRENAPELAAYSALIEAAPPPPKLSDERILEIWASNSGRPVTMGKARIIAQARAIEREILGGNE